MEMTRELPTSAAELSQAVRYLAARCDYATTEDGQGFNGTDAGLGHFLAQKPLDQWTAADARACWEMIGKYRGQLAAGGIDFENIPVPERVNGDARSTAQEDRAALNREARAAASRRVGIQGDEFVIEFAYDPDLVAAARQLPRRRYVGLDKTNRTPRSPEAAVAIKLFIADRNFTVTPEAQAELDRLEAENDETAAEAAARPSAWIERDGDGRIVAYFDFTRDAVAAAKGASGRWDKDRTNSSGKSVWTFALNAGTAKKIADFIELLPDCPMPTELADELHELAGAAERRIEASRAKDAGITIEGLPAEVELRPFQRAGVAYALDARRTFIADDMGTGKTVQAVVALLVAEAYPAIIVCPSGVKLSWAEHVRGPLPYAPNGWTPGKRVAVLSGQTPDAEAVRGADVIVINYDILSYWLEVLKAVRPKGLIFDESHFLKNKGTKKKPVLRTQAALELSKMVRGLKDGLIIEASGTPLLNRPIELVTQLEVMGRLEDFGGFWRFVKRYCGAYRAAFGWDFSGATNLEELNEKLRATCYIRRTKAEVLPELPPKQISHIHVEIDNEREYRAAEADVIEYLLAEAEADEEFAAELEELVATLQAEELTEKQIEIRVKERKRERRDSIMEAANAEHLVRVNKLRELIAKGKTKAAVEWIDNFLESGEKLVVMAYHQDFQKALRDKLAKKYNAAVIVGGMGGEGLRAQETKFQTDDTCRLAIVSLKAGGVGLTLTASSNIAILEQDWTPAGMEQAEDRCHRIGSEQYDSVNVWYLMGQLADGTATIDDDMRSLLAQKLQVTSTVIDGEARERMATVSVLSDLIDRLKERGTTRQEALT